MSVEGTSTIVENLIADHIAASFEQKNPHATTKVTAAQIRNRITDHFQPSGAGSEQDNSPPAVQALYSRLFRAFSLAPSASSSHDRVQQLDRLHEALQEFRRKAADTPQGSAGSVPFDLLLERQQLLLKNEFTVGFGRVEMWLVSSAVLTLVLLNAIDFLWALPILAFGVFRSLHLDRQCKKRCARITEIDAIIESTAGSFHS